MQHHPFSGGIILSILEALKGLIEVTLRNINMRMNMPITLFGKSEHHGDTHIHYHNPIIVQVDAPEMVEKVAATIARHQRPVIEKQGSLHHNPLSDGERTL